MRNEYNANRLMAATPPARDYFMVDRRTGLDDRRSESRAEERRAADRERQAVIDRLLG